MIAAIGDIFWRELSTKDSKIVYAKDQNIVIYADEL